MDRLLGVILVVGLRLSAAATADDKPATPTQQYEALLKEYEGAQEDLSKAQADEERKKIVARLAMFPQRFLELAEKNPKEAIAVDALVQVVAIVNGTAFPPGGKDTPGNRALAILLRDHVRSEKLGRVCQQVAFGFHKSHETFLRTVLEMSPHKDVQGLACLSLAQFLNNRLSRLDVLKEQDKPDMAERYQRVFGKEYLEELQRQDRARVAKEIESLFARAAAEYGDVAIPVVFFGSGGKVGEKAKDELFQIRDLAVGAQSPDIAGEDQDGKRFKLSDYRGQVVLLDFWHHT